jgi:hypothetical protein
MLLLAIGPRRLVFAVQASFVFIGLGRNYSHLIDFIGGYGYPCLGVGVRGGFVWVEHRFSGAF